MGELGRLIAEEDAQTTAEYALVILGAAAVAGALIAWAAGGKAVKDFFSKVFEKLTSGF
jgi:Flp pilus assembly pilin Flp